MGYSETVYYEWECDRCCDIEASPYGSSKPSGWSGTKDYSYCEACTEEMEEEDAAEDGDEYIVWMRHNGLL